MCSILMCPIFDLKVILQDQTFAFADNLMFPEQAYVNRWVKHQLNNKILQRATKCKQKVRTVSANTLQQVGLQIFHFQMLVLYPQVAASTRRFTHGKKQTQLCMCVTVLSLYSQNGMFQSMQKQSLKFQTCVGTTTCTSRQLAVAMQKVNRQVANNHVM